MNQCHPKKFILKKQMGELAMWLSGEWAAGCGNSKCKAPEAGHGGKEHKDAESHKDESQVQRVCGL